MKIRTIALLVSLATCIHSAMADDLLDIIELAKQNDPLYHQAQSLFRVDAETLSQAHSGVFPILQGGISQSTYNRTRTTISSNPTPSVTNNKNRDYHVTLSQPLFNLPSLVEIRRANRIVSKAQAELHAAELDVLVRAATAYFNVLAAQDTLRFTIAEKKANARQLDQVQERFKVGFEAITAVYDARASYDAVVAREIAARTQVDNAFESLREITGVSTPSLAELIKNPPLAKPSPANTDEWVRSALKNNYSLEAKRFESSAAHARVSLARAEYAPKLNIVADFDDNDGRTFGTSSINTMTKDLSFQLSSPMFQGVNLLSVSRQNKAAYEASVADLDHIERSVVSTTIQSYNSVIAGISSVRADRQAVMSAKSSMDSSEAAYHIGTRTIVDVLNAQQILFNNQRRAAADVYATIRALFELKRTAGLLSMDDIRQINAWLKTDELNVKNASAEKSAPANKTLADAVITKPQTN